MRAAGWATPSQAKRFAAGLNEDWLTCRDMGHVWQPVRAVWSPHDHLWRRERECSRCTTTRVEFITNRGEVVGGHYGYPAGYCSDGLGRIAGDARGALRLVSLQRMAGPEQVQAAS